MNLEIIDKWLDNEFGVSYTRLEELHDFVIEQDLKHQEKADKEIEKLTAESTEWESKYYQLQNRIDKAIEYINTLYISVYDPDGYFITINGNDNLEIEDVIKNIENILKGDNK